MIILGIETSCDETSIAVISKGKILCNIISSQIKNHQEYGGVIPELASRLHLENLDYVYKTAIKKAKINKEDIDFIAYTSSPGLNGCLFIGKLAAETLGLFLNKPVIPVDHLHAHIHGALIDNEPEFPALGVLISGGHTQLFLMKDKLSFCQIGETLDDAIGECFDKVARMLDLPYPGGPIVEKKAKKGKIIDILPVPRLSGLNFSYSGLKSACWKVLSNKNFIKNEENINNFCASFQFAACKQLIIKTKEALKLRGPIKTLILAGGVSANAYIRSEFKKLESLPIKVIIPKLEYCTDNAAMVCKLAYEITKFNATEKRD